MKGETMFNRMKAIVGSQVNKAIDSAESKMNPDLLGMNALASSFALLVMADRVAEEEELEAVSEYLIDSVPVVIEKGLIREVSELFLKQVSKLEDGFKKGVVEGNIVVGEILRDISLVKDDATYGKIIAETITLVTSGGDADAGEVKTRKRILTALGKSCS